MRSAVVLLLVASVAVAAKHPNFDPKLPRLGAKFQSLPAGEGKTLVEGSCFPCHAADILVQQRLTEKQWNAELDKMIRWGAVVKETDRPIILAYLTKNFGADNHRFVPIRTRPVGY
jgi:hypothetical protein